MAVEQPSTKLMYCDPCADDREFVLAHEQQTLTVRGEEITLDAPVWRCPDCCASQPYVEGNTDVIKLANDAYRRRHGLLASEEILQIREQYGLSREAFAALLGMSAATLYRYEAGAIQDELHDTLIAECRNPATVASIFQRRFARLTALQQRRFSSALADVTAKWEQERAREAVQIWSQQLRQIATTCLTSFVQRAGASSASDPLGEFLGGPLADLPRHRVAMLLPLAEIAGWEKLFEPISWMLTGRANRREHGAHFTHFWQAKPTSEESFGFCRSQSQRLLPGVANFMVSRLEDATARHARVLKKLHFVYRDLDDDELSESVVRLIAERFQSFHLCSHVGPALPNATFITHRSAE